jgi:membrane protein
LLFLTGDRMHTELRAPHRIEWPWRFTAAVWRRVLRTTYAHISDNHLFMVAAALAFYAMLALFPGLFALVSLYGLLSDPQDVERFVSMLAGILPPSAWETLQEELRALVSVETGSLSLAFAASTVGALWSATTGVDALIEAVNWAYGKPERRSFVRRRTLSLRLTLGLMLAALVAIALVAIVPSAIVLLRQRPALLQVLDIARWPLLAALVTVGLIKLYRVAPCRPRPARWVLSGALLTSVLWLLISGLFSFYVSEFGSYHKTYGALGGVIVLLLWFYWSAFLVLLGAEITAALEGEGVTAAGAGAVEGPSSGAK